MANRKDDRFLFVLFVLMLISSLFQGMKVPVVNAAPYNFIILGTSLLLLAVSINELSRLWADHKALVIACTALFLWCFISAFLSPFRDSVLKYPFKYSQVYFYFLAMLCYASREDLVLRSFRFIYRFMAVLALIAALERLFHHQMLPFLMLFRSEESLEVFPRVAGLMMWPNQLGVLSALAVATGLILLKKGRLGRTEVLIGTLLLLLEVSLSGSRNAWLNTAIAFLLCWPFGAVKFRKLVAAAAVWTIFMFSFAVPTHQLGIEKNPYIPFSRHFKVNKKDNDKLSGMADPTGGARQRKELWQEGIELWYQNSGTGVGLRGSCANWEQKTGRKGRNLHNLELNLLVELGIGGIFLSFLLLIIFLKNLRWTEPLVTIPIAVFFTGQVVDCFIHDITFLAIYGFIFAAIKTNYVKDRD